MDKRNKQEFERVWGEDGFHKEKMRQPTTKKSKCKCLKKLKNIEARINKLIETGKRSKSKFICTKSTSHMAPKPGSVTYLKSVFVYI